MNIMANFDPGFIYHIAKLYYEVGLSQQEISEMEHISRAQISRILTAAKKQNIVEINVIPPDFSNTADLTDSLKECLGIDNVVIVPTELKKGAADNDYLKELDDFCSNAAPYIYEYLQNASIVGVGWGKTTFKIANFLSANNENSTHSDLLFIPLGGCDSGIYEYSFQVSPIISLFSYKLSCKAFYLNLTHMSAVSEDMNPMDYKCYNRLTNYWKKMDTVIFSVGSAKDMGSAVSSHDAIGNFQLQSYSADGKIMPISDPDVISFNPTDLRKVKNSILVSIGERKVSAIYYACKLGYCKTLMTNKDTALSLLNYQDQ